MFLIVGLGNPGAQYAMTRHNVGFMALDRYLGDSARWKSEFKSLLCRGRIEAASGKSEDVIFCKPQTFMNLSGEAVRAIIDFYKIELDRMLVLHDELDIPYGTLKIQKNRGPGGHNGLKSLNTCLGTQDYLRVKIGVGKPTDPRFDISNWVLSAFSKDEQNSLPEMLDHLGDAIECFTSLGPSQLANRFSKTFIEEKESKE